MPMAKKLFNEWWRKRAKDYRKDDDERRLWRAFCSGFYAAKELEEKQNGNRLRIAHRAADQG